MILISVWSLWLAGLMLMAIAAYMIAKPMFSDSLQLKMPRYVNYALALFVASILTKHWMPLGVGKGEFLNFSLLGENVRELCNVKMYNLSVAVWVGFLALFGFATDDGVLISTYIKQVFTEKKPTSAVEIREAIIQAGSIRIRPALMTVATTLLALIPVLTSSGKAADVMIPMAIPSFGGMTIAIITVLTVPVMHSLVAEYRLKRGEEL